MLKPFIIGACIAFVLNLPMKFIEEKWLTHLPEKLKSAKRPLGIVLSLLFFVAVVAFVVVVMVAFILIYKGLGIAAALAMLVFFIAEIWMMIAVPGIVLSMGGVLGIVAAIILTAVGLILTCTRVKEEFAYSEKPVKAALNKGLSQAIVPVVNVSVVSGIIAIAMLIFTKGAIKCFAITFGIGVALSLLATLVISRMFISLLLPLAKNKEKFLDFKKEV
jgi:preprotein translocase subunit SecD